MSNPAVTTLCRTSIASLPVWMDDNIGESIHLHIGDVRIDLTDSEFTEMCFDICDAINEIVEVDGFDCHQINPVYMEDMLWKNLTHLKEVKTDEVLLKDMLCPFFGKYVKLPNSRAVRALEGDSRDNDDHRRSHHIGQTSSERLMTLYESVEKNGYPLNNEYIVLYGNDNVIQDGQHRAACLWKQRGDVAVPVLRFYFDNYTDYDKVSWIKKTKVAYLIRTFKENVPNIRVFIRKCLGKIIRIGGAIKRKVRRNRYMKKYGKYNQDFLNIVDR